MNPSEALVAFDFDDATLATLARICAAKDKTPSVVIHEIIRAEAERHGLIRKEAAAKSA